MGAFHLLLQGLSHVLLQPLTFNTPWRSWGWREEMGHSVLREKLAGQVLQIVRYSQELILWAQFSYNLISRKAPKSFTVMTVSCDSQKLHETSRNFLENMCSIAGTPPITKITHILIFLPCLCGAVSQRYLRCRLPDLSSHFAPQKTYFTTLTLCIF